MGTSCPVPVPPSARGATRPHLRKPSVTPTRWPRNEPIQPRHHPARTRSPHPPRLPSVGVRDPSPASVGGSIGPDRVAPIRVLISPSGCHPHVPRTSRRGPEGCPSNGRGVPPVRVRPRTARDPRGTCAGEVPIRTVEPIRGGPLRIRPHVRDVWITPRRSPRPGNPRAGAMWRRHSDVNMDPRRTPPSVRMVSTSHTRVVPAGQAGSPELSTVCTPVKSVVVLLLLSSSSTRFRAVDDGPRRGGAEARGTRGGAQRAERSSRGTR